MSSILASHPYSPRHHPNRLFSGLLLLLLITLSSLFILLSTRSTLTALAQFFTKETSSTLPNQLGRTNLLLLGLSDPTKKGADLTDIIMFVSLDTQSGDVALLSLPRDIYLPQEQLKINAVYTILPGQIKPIITRLTGQPIHYLATIDFSGFVKIIDIIGGVDIIVDRTFDDYKFPIPGQETALPESLRYEHLHFAAGPVHLDGTTALKFVRSRHALGDEGTDFARSLRQKKVITAIKSRLASPEVLLNPKLLASLIDQFTAIIRSDVPSSRYPYLLKSLLAASDKTPRTLEITDLLTSPSPSRYFGQYVLIPASGNWSETQYRISCFLYTCSHPTPGEPVTTQ